MTYSEALEFIQSADWLGCHPGLERIKELMDRLDNPQDELRFIHIAGSNGKGSTAAMLSAILTEAGYRTGLFTSPHLLRYNERIKINGADISDRDLCVAAEAVRPAVEATLETPTEFERFTAIAFFHFRRMQCDIVILEVGLGGRLDSTNVICAPEAAVITNIGLEHTEFLGGTLEAIAGEKAGIIKPGADVVLYSQKTEVEDVIRGKCTVCGNHLRITAPVQVLSGDLTGQRISYREREDLSLRLLGGYQSRNAAVVLDTVDALRSRGWAISEESIRQGLSKVNWPGRFEVLQKEPLILVDGAHNPDGAKELAHCLATYLPGRKITFIMGVMADKGYLQMLDIIAPLAKRFFTVTPDNLRALPSYYLREIIETRFQIPAFDAHRMDVAITSALREVSSDDVICIFGSLYQIGEVQRFSSN